jgi:hypothetical protein
MKPFSPKTLTLPPSFLCDRVYVEGVSLLSVSGKFKRARWQIGQSTTKSQTLGF